MSYEWTYPARKALKGKLVTRTQYVNWRTPERTRKTRKESMNLSLVEVLTRYAAQRDWAAVVAADDFDE